MNADQGLGVILDKAIHSGDLTREEIIALLSLEGADVQRLFSAADQIRKQYCGEGVHLRGLIEFSNTCSRDCNYCGLRRGNRRIRRYRMTPQEIIDVSVDVAGKGLQTIVLQSGEDPWYAAERMVEIIRGIKSQADCAVTLCIGERSCADYLAMKEAGADRYLLRHETSNPELYHRLHPDMRLEDRVRCLRDLKDIGFQVGAGNMVGLPGQTIEDLANDALFIRDLEADMVGIGPFIPHPNTPLSDKPGGTLEMTLKMVAVVRIVTRNAHVPATTAVGSIDPFGRKKALMAGANVVMPNFTPLEYRVNYEIYPNKRCITEDPSDSRAWIESIGRVVAEGKGHSLKQDI